MGWLLSGFFLHMLDLAGGEGLPFQSAFCIGGFAGNVFGYKKGVIFEEDANLYVAVFQDHPAAFFLADGGNLSFDDDVFHSAVGCVFKSVDGVSDGHCGLFGE